MEQKLDGDPISWVQWRIRGSLVLSSGRTEHIGGGLWERARSLMDYEVDAHYSEIACGWRTRGPILLYIYFGSQANSIRFPSCDDDGPVNLFWLPGIISNYLSHSASLLRLVRLRSLICLQGGRKISLRSWRLWVAHRYIWSYYLLCLSVVAQIERRISAFMERKQMEINENNVREFCNVIDCNQGENGKEVGGRVERESAHRLPMFGRELISTGERSGWTAPRVVLK